MQQNALWDATLCGLTAMPVDISGLSQPIRPVPLQEFDKDQG
jgi:hypothetical protein